jgi:hypothetical protein
MAGSLLLWHAASLSHRTNDLESVVDQARGRLSIRFQARTKESIALVPRVKRAAPRTLVVAGGHHATCAFADLLTHRPGLDRIVLHEGERTATCTYLS